MAHLIRAGKIVTTSSSMLVRDTKDLIEHYSSGRSINGIGFRLYTRDSYLQKKSYVSHLLTHISEAQYYSSSIKLELATFLDSLPDHPSVVSKISSIKKELHPAEYQRLKQEAFHGYFNGGSVGNGAIMPLMYGTDGKISIYNPFYSKEAVSKFLYKIQALIKSELHNASTSLIDKLIENLAIFRIKYAKLADSYQDYYGKIASLLEKRSIFIKLPTDILYVTVALVIATLLSGVLTKEMLFSSVFAVFAAKGTFKFLDRTMKITNYFSSKMQSYLSITGLFYEFNKDLISLTEEFEDSVAKAITR